MPEENINQKFRLKRIDRIRNYLIEEINQKINSGVKFIKKFVEIQIILTTYFL